MNDLEKIADPNNLLEAFKQASKGSIWKSSVQRYEANLLLNIYNTHKALLDGTYKQGPFLEFELNERGHNRRIKALGIADRVVQRSLCDNALMPKLNKYFIHDNGASQKGKGVEFCRRRLENHLHRYYRKYGNEGYCLHIDFRKFFDNIRHDRVLAMLDKYLIDKSIMPLVRQMVNSFKIDISYSDHDLTDEVFNSLEYAKISPQLKTGRTFMYKSLGIGSQVSQVIGVFFPTTIDNYCKIVKGCKFYGRYMDDVYIIHHDKQVLRTILKGVGEQARELGLFINPNKTQISKLAHGFSFLKIRYNLTSKGRLIRRPYPRNITRQRQKMKSFRHLLQSNRLSFADIENETKSWLGALSNLDAWHTAESIRHLFSELFGRRIVYHR